MVDARPPRINSVGHAKVHPERLVVMVDEAHLSWKRAEKPFLVYRGFLRLGAYATHAEAMNVAQYLAKREG